MSFALARYQTARVETASPVRVVVDLYRGALRHMATAVACGRDGSPAVRGRALSKAHAIVSELQATLDRSQAPELCDELDRLYDFVVHRINESCIRADPSLLEPAIDVMKTLEGAWTELAERG